MENSLIPYDFCKNCKVIRLQVAIYNKTFALNISSPVNSDFCHFWYKEDINVIHSNCTDKPTCLLNRSNKAIGYLIDCRVVKTKFDRQTR